MNRRRRNLRKFIQKNHYSKNNVKSQSLFDNTIKYGQQTRWRKFLTKLATNLRKRFAYFIDSRSLHGIRFLDERYGAIDRWVLLNQIFLSSRDWFEIQKLELIVSFCRFYWICILFASLVGMIVLFVYTMNVYENSAISINIDTSYLHWNNTFPAVSFCMLKPFELYTQMKFESFVRTYYAEHNISSHWIG